MELRLYDRAMVHMRVGFDAYTSQTGLLLHCFGRSAYISICSRSPIGSSVLRVQRLSIDNWYYTVSYNNAIWSCAGHIPATGEKVSGSWFLSGFSQGGP